MLLSPGAADSCLCPKFSLNEVIWEDPDRTPASHSPLSVTIIKTHDPSPFSLMNSEFTNEPSTL